MLSTVLAAALLPSATAFTLAGLGCGVAGGPRSAPAARMGMFDGFSKAFENDQTLGKRQVPTKAHAWEKRARARASAPTRDPTCAHTHTHPTSLEIESARPADCYLRPAPDAHSLGSDARARRTPASQRRRPGRPSRGSGQRGRRRRPAACRGRSCATSRAAAASRYVTTARRVRARLARRWSAVGVRRSAWRACRTRTSTSSTTSASDPRAPP